MLEELIEKEGDKTAKENGFIVRKLSWIGRRDAPDKFYSHPDTGVFLVEYKAPGKPLRETQEIEVDRLRKSGVTVYVIDNLEDAYALFQPK